MVSRRRFLAATGAAAVAGCVGAPSVAVPGGRATATGDWPSIGFDGANTGYDPDASGPGADNTQLWSAPLAGDWKPRPPTVADGIVYAQADTHVYAIDAETGEELWTTNVGLFTYRFTPTVAEDRVYVSAIESKDAETPGRVLGLDRATGEIEWSFSNPLIDTSPKLDGGSLYFASQTRGKTVRVHCVDVDAAEERWTFSCRNCQTKRPPLRWAPAVHDGTMYYSVPGGTAVYALDVEDGDERWMQSFDRPVTSAAAVADGTAYVGGVEGIVHAVDTERGETLWTDEPDEDHNMISATPVVGEGRVAVAGSAHVRALDAESGDERWLVDSHQTNNAYLAMADGTVYTGGDTITAFDLADGARRWFHEVNVFHSLFSGCAIADETVYSVSCIKDQASEPYDHFVHAVGRK